MIPFENDDVGPAVAAPAWDYAEAPAGAAVRRTVLNDWENEGGHVSGRHPAEAVGPPRPPGLAAMRARLNTDFANGLVGQRHNTFQHRSRVLAQLTKQAETVTDYPLPDRKSANPTAPRQ